MKSLIIISQTEYQPVEYSDTREELEKEGIQITVASFEKGEATATDDSKTNVDISFDEVNTNDYDAVVIIGGPGASKTLIGNEKVKEIVLSADNDHKIIAAICISPVILAEAQLLRERKATVFNLDGKQQVKLECNGAKYIDQPVVQDTRIITANGPSAAKEFGKTIAKTLKEGYAHLS